MPIRTYYFAQEDMVCAFCGRTIPKRAMYLKRKKDGKRVPWCGCDATAATNNALGGERE